MRRPIEHRIPKELLQPLCEAAKERTGQCADSWVTYEYERIKRELGPEWAHIPVDDVRTQCINLRKANSVKRAKKGRRFSPEYEAALQRPAFRDFFSEVCLSYGNRCCICNAVGKLEPHHRTYETLGYEEFRNDVIPVCRKCHDVCDTRRKKQRDAEAGS